MSKILEEFKTNGQSNNNWHISNSYCGYFTGNGNSYSLAYGLF